MTKKYFSLLTITTIAPIVAMVSCQANENMNQTFVLSSPETLSLQPYDLDYSVELATTPKAHDYKTNLGAGKMVRIQTTGAAEYNENGTKVLKSAYSKYKMDLISEIHLIDSDGNKTIFNSDEADEPQSQSQEAYVFLSSSNVQSINHPNFKTKLATATKVTFKVKDNVYWINSKGEKQEHKVRAADFVYSYLRSYYNGYFQRVFANDGGTNAADNAINEEFKLGSHFRGDRLFTKNQLFEVYGVSSAKFRDLDNSINPTNDELTFEAFNATVKPDFTTFFEQMIVRANIISAAPSEYIKSEYEKKYKPEFEKHQSQIESMTTEQIYTKYKTEFDEALAKADTKETKETLAAAKKKRLIAEFRYGTGLVLKTGVYWYGLSGWEKNLYSGAYYPAEKKGNSLIFLANPQFADQSWVVSKDKIEKFIIEYESNKTSDNAFNKFKQGSISQINFNQLTQEQRAELTRNKDNYTYKYLKELNANRSITKSAILNNPAPLPSAQGIKDKDANYDYSFNDAFAKIMYGRDKATLKKANNYGVSRSLYESYGLAFKSIITAALNWEHIAKQSTGDESAISWVAQVAPDTNVGGSDQATSTKKTPRDFAQEINTLFAVDQNGQLISGSKVTPTENLAAINSADVKASYKSATFTVLQKAMQDLLASIAKDEKLKLETNFTLEWEIANTAILNEKTRMVYQNIVETLEKLSSRIKPKFKELKTNQEIINYYSGFQNFYRRSSIEYDFNGVGSWLDKKSHDTGLSPWALYKIFSTKDPKDPKNPFPEFTKMAIELKKQTESNNFKLPEVGSFDKWDNFLSELESQIYLSKKLFDDDTVVRTVGVGGMAYKWDPNIKEFSIDNIIEFAKFGKKYQESKTNAELVNLIKEFNILKGISINTDSQISSSDVVNIAFYQKGLDIPISKTAIAYAADIKLKK